MNILAIFSWGGTTWTGDFKCREVKTGFFRKRWMQTGSSGTLIGCKSGQNTFFPPWDRMEGAWLWTLYSIVQWEGIETGKNQPMTFSYARRNFRAFLYICVRKQVKQPFLYLRLHPIPSKCPTCIHEKILRVPFQCGSYTQNFRSLIFLWIQAKTYAHHVHKGEGGGSVSIENLAVLIFLPCSFSRYVSFLLCNFNSSVNFTKQKLFLQHSCKKHSPICPSYHYIVCYW